MFEVQDLRYATLATVSRCGMVWFSKDTLSMEVIFENFIARLRNIAIDEADEGLAALTPKGASGGAGPGGGKAVLSPTLQVCVGVWVCMCVLVCVRVCGVGCGCGCVKVYVSVRECM